MPRLSNTQEIAITRLSEAINNPFTLCYPHLVPNYTCPYDERRPIKYPVLADSGLQIRPILRGGAVQWQDALRRRAEGIRGRD